jgi:hypothetical protein
MTNSTTFVLARILADTPFACKMDDDAIYADFESINWKTLHQLAGVTTEACTHALDLAPELFLERQLITRREALAFAVIMIVVAIDEAEQDKIQTMQTIVARGLEKLMQPVNITADLFIRDITELPSDLMNSVDATINTYLSMHGGKSISTPLTISVGDKKFALCGKYAAAPPVTLQAEETRFIDAIIDGIIISESSLYLTATEKQFTKKAIAFDEAKYFPVLHEWMAVRDFRRLTIRSRQLANGEFRWTLADVCLLKDGVLTE